MKKQPYKSKVNLLRNDLISNSMQLTGGILNKKRLKNLDHQMQHMVFGSSFQQTSCEYTLGTS